MTNKTLIILSPQLNAIQILITQYNMVKELTYIQKTLGASIMRMKNELVYWTQTAKNLSHFSMVSFTVERFGYLL